MKKALMILMCLSMSLSTGCVYYSAPVMPPPGLFFTSIQAPIDTDVNTNPIGPKVGEATSTSVLGLFAFGDASVASAAQDGNLTKINHLDYEYFNLLFLFQKFTTRAHGE